MILIMLSPTASEVSATSTPLSPLSPVSNTPQSMSIQVVVRLRPITNNDRNKPGKDSSEPAVTTSMTSNTVILPSLSNRFFYDYVFDDSVSQSSVYSKSVLSMVSSFLEGFNITILAYGQTSSGKTYTMGTSGMTNSDSDGIIPRAIKTIFDTVNSSNTPDKEMSVYISYLELYNEDLIDLLVEAGPSELRSNIQIREDRGKIIWSGIREVQVTSPEDVSQLLHIGSTRRQTASTDMNSVSSRSHAIFSVNLVQYRVGRNNTKSVVRSKCHFVDLAGSERLKRTGASGDRAKEGININAGLLALGNVISALGDASKKNTHIPYRDSKLTRLLQDSIGGNSYTMMIACISPVKADANETYNTLKYANRARNIKNRISKDQEDVTDLPTLKAIIQELSDELEKYRSGSTNGSTNPTFSAPAPTPSSSTTAIPASNTPMYYLIKRAQILEKDLLIMKRKYAMLQAKLATPRPGSSLAKLEPPRSSFSDNASIVFSETSNSSDFHKLIEPVVEEYEQTLKTVERDLVLSREENLSLETELNHLRSKFSALESTYSSQSKTAQVLRLQMEELLEENIQLQESIELRDSSDKPVFSHPDRAADVSSESRLATLEKENASLKAKIDSLSSSSAPSNKVDWESKYLELELRLKEFENIQSATNEKSTPSIGASSNALAQEEITTIGLYAEDSHLEDSLRELEELESAAALMQEQILNRPSNYSGPKSPPSSSISPQSERLDILEIELRNKSDQLAKLEAQILSKTSQVTTKEHLTASTAKETNLQSSVQELNKKIKVLQLAEADHKSTIIDLEAQIKALESDLQNTRFTNSADSENTTDQISHYISKVRSLEESNVELSTQLELTRKKIEVLTSDNSSSKTTGSLFEDTIKKQQLEIQQLTSSLEKTNALLVSTQKDLMDREAEINSLKKDHSATLSSFEEKLKLCSSNRDEQNHEIDLLKQELKSSKSSSSFLKEEVCDRDSTIQKLESDISFYTEKIKSLEESLKSAQEEIQEQHALVGLQMEKSSSEKAEVLRLKKTIVELEKSLAETQNKVDSSNSNGQESTIMREQLKILTEKLESTQRELIVSSELVDALEAELQKTETSFKESQRASSSADTRYAETVKRLEGDRQYLTDKLHAVTKEYEIVLERSTRFSQQVRLSGSHKDDEVNSQSSGSRRSKSKFICI